MKKGGRVPRPEVVHVLDAFVWVPQLTKWTIMDLIRVRYYTSAVGDAVKVAAIEEKIANTRFECSGKDYAGNAKLIPRVHHKRANSKKTKVVDIDIAIDVMRATVEMPIDAIYLLSGDGDYCIGSA
jgi:uncharacterized LabA/DUF88 family protein